jgi:hypothetical protein
MSPITIHIHGYTFTLMKIDFHARDPLKKT